LSMRSVYCCGVSCMTLLFIYETLFC